jgi:hypothetical protein
MHLPAQQFVLLSASIWRARVTTTPRIVRTAHD